MLKYNSFFAQIIVLAETLFLNTESILKSDAKVKSNKERKINNF